MSLDVNIQMSIFRQWTSPTSGVGVPVFVRCPSSDLLIPQLFGEELVNTITAAKREFQVTLKVTCIGPG